MKSAEDLDIAIISSANGGVGSFTFNLVRKMGQYVHSIDLYLYTDSSRNVPSGDLPENVNIASTSSTPLQFAADLAFSTPKIVKRDIVHNIILSPYILGIYPISYFTGFSLVNTVHPQPVMSTTDWNLKSLINEIYQKLEKSSQPLVSRISDETVTVSHDSKELIEEKWGVSPEVVYHGVDDEEFSPDVEGSSLVREDLGIGESEYLFLFVGILYPKKDILTLIDAIPDVIKERDDCHFLVIGRGGEYDLLQERIESKGVAEYVTSIEYVEDIAKYYSAADLFVMPSFIEEFGIVYVEAMQSALPIIAADIDVANEVVGDAGVYFEPRNSQALSDTILSLLSDEDKQNTLASNGEQRAKEFNWDSAAQEYAKIYETIAND